MTYFRRAFLFGTVFNLGAVGVAVAADLPPAPYPPPAPPPVYVPVTPPPFSWTGFYAGLNLGYGFGANAWDFGQQLAYVNVPGQSFAVGGRPGATTPI